MFSLWLRDSIPFNWQALAKIQCRPNIIHFLTTAYTSCHGYHKCRSPSHLRKKHLENVMLCFSFLIFYIYQLQTSILTNHTNIVNTQLFVFILEIIVLSLVRYAVPFHSYAPSQT